MKNPIITVTLPKTEGTIKANVKVDFGVVTVRCTLDQKDGTYYLNNPSKKVKNVEFNNGHIDQAWFDKKTHASVKESTIAAYEKAAAEAQAPAES